MIMEKYIRIITVSAKPMTSGEFFDSNLPLRMTGSEDGYLVQYEDDSVIGRGLSPIWERKEYFEKNSSLTKNRSFSFTCSDG